MALLLGLTAGLFALLAPIALRTDLMTPFMELWSGSANEALAGRLIWYGVPAAAVLGGLLVTFAPGFAMIPLAAAALGWLGMGLAMPAEFDYRLMAPAAASGLAAVLALISAELAVRRRRMERRKRRSLAQGDDGADEIEREAALRMDPLAIPRDQVQQPRRVVELDLDEVAPSPSGPPPRWQDLDAEPAPRPKPDIWGEAIRPEREQPAEAAFTIEVDDEPEPQVRPSPAQRGFSWDRADAPVGQRFGQGPAPGPTLVQVRRSAPAEPPPRQAEPVARTAPATASRAASVVEASPLWPEPELQRSYREPETPVQRPKRSGGLVAALLAVVTVVVLGVLAAAGYLAYREGWVDRLVALVTPQSGTPDAAGVPVIETAPAAPQVASQSLALPPEPELASTHAEAGGAPAAMAVLPSKPSAAAVPPASTYADPFAYCSAVGTIDYADQRYVGPATTPAIAQALAVPESAPRDRVHWRCADGAVLACTSYIGPICDVTPTVDEMRDYCARYPSAPQLMAPGGVWSCVNGKPQLPEDAAWPVDARGYRTDSWITVKPASTSAG